MFLCWGRTLPYLRRSSFARFSQTLLLLRVIHLLCSRQDKCCVCRQVFRIWLPRPTMSLLKLAFRLFESFNTPLEQKSNRKKMVSGTLVGIQPRYTCTGYDFLEGSQVKVVVLPMSICIQLYYLDRDKYRWSYLIETLFAILDSTWYWICCQMHLTGLIVVLPQAKPRTLLKMESTANQSQHCYLF